MKKFEIEELFEPLMGKLKLINKTDGKDIINYMIENFELKHEYAPQKAHPQEDYLKFAEFTGSVVRWQRKLLNGKETWWNFITDELKTTQELFEYWLNNVKKKC